MVAKTCHEDGLVCPHPHKSCDDCIEEENRWAEAWIKWFYVCVVCGSVWYAMSFGFGELICPRCLSNPDAPGPPWIFPQSLWSGDYIDGRPATVGVSRGRVEPLLGQEVSRPKETPTTVEVKE